MLHPTGRVYSDYEVALINGTAPTRHKPQSLVEIHHAIDGCRIVHQPRGNMERLREKQRKSNGSGRGLYSIIELPDSIDGQDLYQILSGFDAVEIQYQPCDGADNFWNATVTAKIEPELAHRRISESLTKNDCELVVGNSAIVTAPSIKGIF